MRACMAALGIQQQATRLAAMVEDRDGVSLWLRVGGRTTSLHHPVLVGLWRDIELGGEYPSFEALVLSHILF